MTRSDISSLIQEAERFRIAAQAADWIQAEIEDMIEVSTVAPQPVDWLYPGWIPRGKLTVLFGRPGIGKSHVALDIAARFTTARTMPGCGLPCEAGNVLLFAAEDGVADTIRPRLDAAGANSARVKMFRHGGFDTIACPEALSICIRNHRLGLVIIDPLAAYAGKHDLQNDQSARRMLTPLINVARLTGAAILVIHHSAKSEQSDAMRQMAGSQGIAALSRSVLMVCLDPESIDHRILIPVKGNLVVSPPPQRFHLVQDKARVHPRIVWDGVADSVTLETLMARSRGRDGVHSRLAHAEAFLRDVLAKGPVASRQLSALAREVGIAAVTLERACVSLRLGYRKVSDGDGKVYWERYL